MSGQHKMGKFAWYEASQHKVLYGLQLIWDRTHTVLSMVLAGMGTNNF